MYNYTAYAGFWTGGGYQQRGTIRTYEIITLVRPSSDGFRTKYEMDRPFTNTNQSMIRIYEYLPMGDALRSAQGHSVRQARV